MEKIRKIDGPVQEVQHPTEILRREYSRKENYQRPYKKIS